MSTKTMVVLALTGDSRADDQLSRDHGSWLTTQDWPPTRLPLYITGANYDNSTVHIKQTSMSDA